MNPAQPSDDDTLIRYLLGEPLSEALVDLIEEQYFQSDRYFDHVSGVEEELIDSYIHGRLLAHDRRQFETHFLASAHRRKKWEEQQAIANFFRTSAAPAPFLTALGRFLRSQSPAIRFAMACAGVILAVGLGALGAGYLRLSEQDRTLQARLSGLEDQATHASVVTFVLEPGLLRGGDGNRLRIPAAAEWVALRLHLSRADAERSSYTAALSTAEGEELWRQTRLLASGRELIIRLPKSSLSRGDYVLSVAGSSAENSVNLPSYAFTIE